jgi:hypothetical protein
VPRVTRKSSHTRTKKNRNWKLLKSMVVVLQQLKQPSVRQVLGAVATFAISISPESLRTCSNLPLNMIVLHPSACAAGKHHDQ